MSKGTQLPLWNGISTYFDFEDRLVATLRRVIVSILNVLSSHRKEGSLTSLDGTFYMGCL